MLARAIPGSVGRLVAIKKERCQGRSAAKKAREGGWMERKKEGRESIIEEGGRRGREAPKVTCSLQLARAGNERQHRIVADDGRGGAMEGVRKRGCCCK